MESTNDCVPHCWTVSGGATCLYSETGIVACSRTDSTRLNLLRSYVDLIRAMKEDLEDWRDGSVLESPHCFCREPDIQLAACISGGSLAITPPGALMPPSGLHGHQYTSAHICTHLHKDTYIHPNNLKMSRYMFFKKKEN